jgi:acylphosphatase
VKLLVSGRVQGVGFRWFVRDAAQRIGLRGDVCNLPDGRVEIRLRGTETCIESLIDTVRSGPLGSGVEGLLRTELDREIEADGFCIRR